MTPNKGLHLTAYSGRCAPAFRQQVKPGVGLREEPTLVESESATDGERGILGSYPQSGGACEVPHPH